MSALFAVSGCHRAASPPAVPAKAADKAWFADVTQQVGLDFVHNPGPSDRYAMPESMGSGAAMLDYDNDGRLDLYLLQGGDARSGATNRLYHQEANGRFSDATAKSGLGITGYGMGAAVGDANNDGLPDMLVCGYGSVRLFLNSGKGVFRDVTRESGLSNPFWGVSAAFFDYDRDGKLDLVVVNYVNYVDKSCPDPSGLPDYCGPAGFKGTDSRLFHNAGIAGGKVRFADVTQKAGLANAPGAGLGVSTLDFNADGWPDMLITRDGQPNRLWINGHNGTFKDEAVRSGIAVNNSGTAQANMGIAIGDLTGSGQPSLYVTHLSEEGNTLWSPVGGGLFEDRTAAAGLAAVQRGTGFGTTMTDFDNDGFLDLGVVNGRVRHAYGAAPKAIIASLGAHWSPYAETNQLFANDGHGRFRDISSDNAPFCSTPNVGRGLVCGDVFNDGGMDMLVTSIAGRARLFRNAVPQRGHWLGVRAVDPRLGGRDAYGARITVTAGGRRQVSWINPAYSMACSNDPRAHFGLGATKSVSRVEVLWPDGKRESFSGVAVDRILTLRRGAGK